MDNLDVDNLDQNPKEVSELSQEPLVITKDNKSTKSSHKDYETDSEFERQMMNVEFVREHTVNATKQKFEDMLKENLNTMRDYFDNRITMAIDEAFEIKVQPIIAQEVEKQIKQDSATTHIQSEVARYVRKSVTLATNETVIQKITEKVTTDMKAILTNLMTDSETRLQNLTTKSHTNISDEFIQINQKLSKQSNKDIDRLQDTCRDLKISINTQYDSHIQNLQTHETTHVNHINELAETVTNNMKHIQPPKPPKQEYFNIGDNVLYTDDTTGQECNATVVDIHDDDGDQMYYTVELATGKHRKTDNTTLKRLSTTEKPLCNRFDKVDGNASPPPVSSTAIPPDNDSKTSTALEPTAFDIRSFLSQFKASLRSDDYVINLYLQLKSQGENYNIHLIDINDMQPDNDLSQIGISPSARKKNVTSNFSENKR